MPDIIEKNPKVMSGQPVIRGTRIPIARVLALIGLEYTLKDLKKELPDLARLTEEDITTILSYYRDRIEHGKTSTKK